MTQLTDEMAGKDFRGKRPKCDLCGCLHATGYLKGKRKTMAVCWMCAEHALPKLMADTLTAYPWESLRLASIWNQIEREFWRRVAVGMEQTYIREAKERYSD